MDLLKYTILKKAKIHLADLASECTLPIGVGFNGERCKLYKFLGCLRSGHDLPNMVMTTEKEGKI